jgi:hypothetical protein
MVQFTHDAAGRLCALTLAAPRRTRQSVCYPLYRSFLSGFENLLNDLRANRGIAVEWNHYSSILVGVDTMTAFRSQSDIASFQQHLASHKAHFTAPRL